MSKLSNCGLPVIARTRTCVERLASCYEAMAGAG